MPFFKNWEQEDKTGPVWEMALVAWGRIKWKGVRGWILWNYYVLIYKNGQMRHAEAIPGMEGGGDTGE
jgi:hypothetical protein